MVKPSSRKGDPRMETIKVLKLALIASRHEVAQLKHENEMLRRSAKLLVAALPKAN
jgi:hypothetical protein